jgi:hypothetical protein
VFKAQTIVPIFGKFFNKLLSFCNQRKDKCKENNLYYISFPLNPLFKKYLSLKKCLPDVHLKFISKLIELCCWPDSLAGWQIEISKI